MAKTAFSFGLSPEQAIAYLRNKKAILDQVDDVALLTSARGKAARIANLSSLEMTKDIYQSLIDAQQAGKPFHQWQQELLAEMKHKGWLHNINKKAVIADPKTGEIFGTPRRLRTIYQTNTQAAYSAQRYQQQRDNAINRPYWQYTAVGDKRTRPSHNQMNGLVYRYDDPFWQTFYPPNGFNCRCTVIALAQRDIERQQIEVKSSEGQLIVQSPRQLKNGVEYTTGYKLPNGTIIQADRGFDYNVGRVSYRPNLDNYPTPLAYQFTKREMAGDSFKLDYLQFQQEFKQIKQQLGLIDKLSSSNLIAIRNQLRKEYKFSAGVLTNQDQLLLNSTTKTVWLSDDSLLKQFNSREGQGFTSESYAILPDIINQAEFIVRDGQDKYHFVKNGFVTIIKSISGKELFILSFRKIKEVEMKKMKEKYTVIR
ncbi:phage minor head protein [Volucribacter amazonae]|uniref:Phage head morphogenesis protein n=1 Tax=Volucribacter amazonae TaxID=256731 RepID=A0A9X4SLH4_9PAST|nr:phage minor head protein [Volucribacter amazonae]MDG6895048.1 phage head morphogenesis protein [Volucribacter amazonae]